MYARTRSTAESRMININLLPHREHRQQQRQQRFQLALALVFVAGVAVFLCSLIAIHIQRAYQRQRTQILQLEHDKLDRQLIQKTSVQKQIDYLAAQLKGLCQLQQQRNDAVKLLAQLAQDVPSGVYLRAVKQETGHLSLHGYAAAHQDIVRMLDKLSDADTLQQVQLRHITQVSTRHEFIITATLRRDGKAP